MSGKSEINNTSSGNNKTSIEQALKEVFYIHRSTVKEFQCEIGEWISSCEGYQEENKILNEKLKKYEKEKEKLEEKIKSKTNNYCVMCEHLRESIKVVKDAYNSSIQEKDNMIQFLKGQSSNKCDYTLPLTDVSNIHLTKESHSRTPQKSSSTTKPENSGSQKKKHSPDSTMNSANKKTDKTDKQLKFNKSDEESDEQCNRSGDKLRLARKNKRSRYKEDISPTNKKIKVNSNNNSSESETPEKDVKGTYSKKDPQKQQNRTKLQITKPNRSPGINFAPETCFDRSASFEDHDEEDGPTVVPETLGMETYTSSEEDDSEEVKTQKAKHPNSRPTLKLDVTKKTHSTPTKKTKSVSKSASIPNQIDDTCTRSIVDASSNTKTDSKHKSNAEKSNKSLRLSTSLNSLRNYADNTTDILNSPDSEVGGDEVSVLQPIVSASETDILDNMEDEHGDSGYTSRLEKSRNGSQQNKSQTKNKLFKTGLKKGTQDNKKFTEVGKNSATKKVEDETVQYEPISKEQVSQPLKLDLNFRNSCNSQKMSPIFTKPAVMEEREELSSPLLLQSGKTLVEAPKRSLRTKKSTTDKQISISRKSSHKLEATSNSDKKVSPREIPNDYPERSNLKQTTLSEVFTSSPKQSAPPFESEEERQRMQEAIKQSLLEFQNTSQEYKKKNNDISTTSSKDFFKKPLSPKTTPRKRRPSGKKSPLASPDKYFSSPQKSNTAFDPDDTMGPSPNSIDSLPIIPLRRSPRKSVLNNSPSVSRGMSCNRSLDEMDETMAPSPSMLDSLGRQTSGDDVIDSRIPLNRSIDPDVQLTQFFDDSESCDQYKSSPDLKKAQRKVNSQRKSDGRKTRRTLDMASTEESQSLPCSSKSYKFGTRREKKLSIDTQEDLSEEEGISKEQVEFNEERMKDDEDKLPEQDTTFDSSFDKVPSKKGPDFAHVKVVKKQDERRKLKGHSCKECYEYYKLTGMSDEEIQNRIQDCSRHRADYIPPSTPEHYWSIGFPDTQECQERGYAQVERNTKPSTYRRKRQLQKKFKTKDDTTGGKKEENGEQDLLFN